MTSHDAGARLSGIVVSLVTREPEAQAKFHALEHRLHLGEPLRRG